MAEVGSGDSVIGGSVLMSADVSSDGDGGLLSLASGSSSLHNEGAVTMIGGESLVSNGEDVTMSAGSSVGRTGEAFILVSSSGSTIGRYVSLIGCRGGSDIRGCVSPSTGISSYIC